MRAAQVTRLDGPDAVEVVELPEPTGAGVVIEVAAAGICFPDVLLTRGQYQITPDLPFVPGSEVAGIVRSAPVSSGYTAGDRVAAFPFLGGFAEVVEADAAMVFALRERGRLREGETVLVQGAAGGIGTAAVQLAAAWGARVIAVVSTQDKAEVAKAAGAHEVVLADGFRDAVAGLTGRRGVDVVVDPVGGDR